VPLATIDVGGSYLGHATLPTDDILGALGRNALHDESGNWAPGATAIGPSVAEPTAMVLLIGKCCFRVRTIPIRTKMADATRHGPGI
jgi:hypothetical protein